MALIRVALLFSFLFLSKGLLANSSQGWPPQSQDAPPKYRRGQECDNIPGRRYGRIHCYSCEDSERSTWEQDGRGISAELWNISVCRFVEGNYRHQILILYWAKVKTLHYNILFLWKGIGQKVFKIMIRAFVYVDGHRGKQDKSPCKTSCPTLNWNKVKPRKFDLRVFEILAKSKQIWDTLNLENVKNSRSVWIRGSFFMFVESGCIFTNFEFTVQ